jgi:hypothetical protein
MDFIFSTTMGRQTTKGDPGTYWQLIGQFKLKSGMNAIFKAPEAAEHCISERIPESI